MSLFENWVTLIKSLKPLSLSLSLSHTHTHTHKIWLPPTPPTDDNPEYYVDLSLEMSYNTNNTMTPDELTVAGLFTR